MGNFVGWRQLHCQEYTAQRLETAFNTFVGLSAVVFNMGKASPMEHLIPNHSLRLLLTRLLFADSGSLVAVLPLGKLSGAHINPSVSLAFWVQGKMHQHRLGGDIVGELVGRLLGALLLLRVWQGYAMSVKNSFFVLASSVALLDCSTAWFFISCRSFSLTRL